MDSLQLKVNQSKSCIIIAGGTKRDKVLHFSADTGKIEVVDSFPYLGILFDKDLSWAKLMEGRKLVMERGITAVKSFPRKLGARPLVPIKNIYQPRVKAALTYGAGVWGTVAPAPLQTIENII